MRRRNQDKELKIIKRFMSHKAIQLRLILLWACLSSSLHFLSLSVSFHLSTCMPFCIAASFSNRAVKLGFQRTACMLSLVVAVEIAVLESLLNSSWKLSKSFQTSHKSQEGTYSGTSASSPETSATMLNAALRIHAVWQKLRLVRETGWSNLDTIGREEKACIVEILANW